MAGASVVARPGGPVEGPGGAGIRLAAPCCRRCGREVRVIEIGGRWPHRQSDRNGGAWDPTGRKPHLFVMERAPETVSVCSGCGFGWLP